MRKQTKLVAVLSTAALLALGASMSSFAAVGWAEENGTWVYYDKNEDLVTEKWAKSGDNWFYLNDDGEMATDALIEYNDSYYYVDENGAMVTNQWVSIENEDYDGDDDDSSNFWYYFQANGKAIKGSDNSVVSLKTINGKKYVFDNEGKMLHGWVDINGERVTGEDAWTSGEYYFGDENDGAMTVGWILLNITDTNATDTDVLDTAFDDEDQERWFYFKTNGRKMTNETGKTINGKKYAFDADGRMTAEWSMNASYATPGSTTATPSTLETGAQSNQWRYYGTPEDGARVTKGWFKVVPAKGLHASKYNNDEDRWYYSNNDGKLVANELKNINGKKYAFDERGGMVSGLKFISVLKSDKNQIVTIHDGDYYDTEGEFDAFANGVSGSNKPGEAVPNFDWSSTTDDYVTYAYYFGGGEDGAMKTGKQNVDIDGDTFTFLFNKSGGTKGAGKIGEDDDKYYLNGKLMKADKDDKYSVIEVTKTGTAITSLKLLTTDQFVTGLGSTLTADNTVTVNGETVVQKKDNAYYSFPTNNATVTYHLVNTTGKVEDGDKTKAKDGDSICYQVKDGKIVAVYEEK